MSRSNRLFDLIQILRDGRLHRAADLALDLGVSVRSIWRDMAMLAASGMPVEGERGVGYMLRQPITLPPMMLQPAELIALRLGVRLVTVLASGFSESGPEGLAREQALQAIASSSGLRVIGPSSLGVVNPRACMPLTANAAFAEPDMPVGRVMVVSHSGSMIGALVSRGRARGVGFASLVSVGNEVDLSVGEICAATLDDPQIKGYVLFLESLQT